MNIKKQNILAFLFLILFQISAIYSQNEPDVLQTQFTFDKTTYIVKDILEYIVTNKKINLVYSESDSLFNQEITLPLKTLTLDKLLKHICSELPFEFILKDEYIILKRRKLLKSYEIKGRVIDSETKEYLIAANVFLKGSEYGIITNETGKYSLKLPPGNYTLHCTYMGYNPVECNFNLYEDKEHNFILKQAEHLIDEVKITSQKQLYGNIEVGRTIETIESKQIEELNVNNPSDILHGRINGVWATQTSGAPGDHQKVRVRGINSLFGSVDPLYIVDGVPVPNVNLKSLGIADLNIHDIDNVTVLKDASSTAIYGYMGGNGVIIIDTKKDGEKKISLQVKQGFQWFNMRYELMNTKDFLYTYYLSDSLLHTNFFTLDSARFLYPKYPMYDDSTLGYDNWQETIFQQGKVNDYQLSAQGNFKTIDYYISGNYFNHKGIIVNSSYDKYSLTSNFGKTIKGKCSLHLNYKASHQKNFNNLDNFMGNSLIYRGINTEPAFKTTSEDYLEEQDRFHFYEPNHEYSETYNQLVTDYSPENVIDNFKRNQEINIHSINGLAKYQLLNNLFFNASSSVSFRNYLFTSDVINQYLSSNEKYVILNQQYNLAYDKEINNHEFKLVTGVKLYRDNVHWEIDSVLDETSFIQRYYSPKEEIFLRGSMSKYGEAGSVRRTINSLIGHINYNYKKKYFISLVANYDHLKEGRSVNIWDFFPSVAINWDISREFGPDRIKQFDYFNLYVNWGQSGNYPLNGLSNDLYNEVSYYYSDSASKGYHVTNLANHKLSHEKIDEYNFGTELSLFKTRAILNFDYFIKFNTDLLIHREIPFYYGGGEQFINVGKMENKGIEFSIDLIPVHTSNFSWHTKFGYYSNNQIIKQLKDTNDVKFNELDILIPDFIIKEDERIGSITGFKFLGEWSEEDELADNIIFAERKGLKYLNVDTLIRKLDENDKTIIGNSIPDFTWNFYNSISYKNFNINFLWHAVIGVSKYNATRAATYITGTNKEVYKIISDTLNYLSDHYFYESSAFVEDASFIRLKHLTFMYSPAKKLFNQVYAKFSISFENLITITTYKGYDPEATIYTNNNFSDNAIDRGAYPIPKGMYFSINLTY